MKKLFIFFFPILLLAKELPFVIVIPSYNNEDFCEANLQSALQQKYENFRILYIDDKSTDRTLDIIQEIVEKEEAHDRVQIIANSKRLYSLCNIYTTIHNEVRDEEIVVILDGDDQIAHPKVLQILNRTYQQKNPQIWFAYSQFCYQSTGKKGWGRPMPSHIIEKNAFRSYVHLPTHLRTFYGWLFKKIKKRDLMHKKDFYRMTGDSAFIFPMIEMARDHFTFINEILYTYNDRNPISDHKIDWNLQMQYNKKIRKQPSYNPLTLSEI